jgi:hypothetical protein
MRASVPNPRPEQELLLELDREIALARDGEHVGALDAEWS